MCTCIYSCLCVGGEINSEKKTTQTCELYHPDKDKWMGVDPLPEPRSCHACVAHKGNIFISGGLGEPPHPQTTIW